MTTAKLPPLLHLSPDEIEPNPDNPRLVFHEEDMNALLVSIKEAGIKVPITVYPEGKNRYVLLDGERRWRCSRKLNLTQVPAIVQPKPTKLENLLMMFNIHNVRVDWDIMPMALKLGEIRKMLEAEGKPTTPRALATITGVSHTTVKRALELLDLPKHFQTLLLDEARKPRSQQQYKADLFIEIYKSMHAVKRYTPEVFETVSPKDYVEALVEKYGHGIISNVTEFRNVSRIARAERAGADKRGAAPAILKLVRNKDYSIKKAYEETVELSYRQRDLTTRAGALAERLSQMKSARDLGQPAQDALAELRREITRLLGDE